jgi:hypothetical protein
MGSHDLALNSPVTSEIGLESPLLAVLACLGFSRKNQRSAFSDFCNTIPLKAEIGIVCMPYSAVGSSLSIGGDE